jgi:nucleoside-diphosphate-sugar epimerase
MKYFITGATGFVGGVLAKQLREAGHEVRASVRSLEKAKDLQTLGVKLYKGDVTEKESMREPMTGVDGVFHVAGWYKIGTKDKSGGEQVNIQGTRNVLELMQELKIPKGVYTSTLAVNSDTHGQIVDESYRFAGKHLSEYDRTKAVAHEIAEEFITKGLPLVIVDRKSVV